MIRRGGTPAAHFEISILEGRVSGQMTGSGSRISLRLITRTCVLLVEKKLLERVHLQVSLGTDRGPRRLGKRLILLIDGSIREYNAFEIHEVL